MKKTKKVFMIAMMTGMAISLAACGSKKESKKEEEETYSWQIDAEKFDKMSDKEQEKAMEDALAAMEKEAEEEDASYKAKKEKERAEISDYTVPGLSNIRLEDLDGTNISDALCLNLESMPMPKDIGGYYLYDTYKKEPAHSKITGDELPQIPHYKLTFRANRAVYKEYKEELKSWFCAQMPVCHETANGNMGWLDSETRVEYIMNSKGEFFSFETTKAVKKSFDAEVTYLGASVGGKPMKGKGAQSMADIPEEGVLSYIDYRFDDVFEDSEAGSSGRINFQKDERSQDFDWVYADVDKDIAVGDHIHVEITTTHNGDGKFTEGSNFVQVSVQKIN